MKIPEWRPMPRHWNNDDDTGAFGASLRLIVPVVLIAVGLALVLLGVFAR